MGGGGDSMMSLSKEKGTFPGDSSWGTEEKTTKKNPAGQKGGNNWSQEGDFLIREKKRRKPTEETKPGQGRSFFRRGSTGGVWRVQGGNSFSLKGGGKKTRTLRDPKGKSALGNFERGPRQVSQSKGGEGERSRISRKKRSEELPAQGGSTLRTEGEEASTR